MNAMLDGVCQRAQALLRSWIRQAFDPADIPLPKTAKIPSPQSSQAKDLATKDYATMGHAPDRDDTDAQDAQSPGQGHKAQSGGQGSKDLPSWLGTLFSRVRSRLVASFGCFVLCACVLHPQVPCTVRAGTAYAVYCDADCGTRFFVWDALLCLLFLLCLCLCLCLHCVFACLFFLACASTVLSVCGALRGVGRLGENRGG